jgi:hypothetical protein
MRRIVLGLVVVAALLGACGRGSDTPAAPNSTGSANDSGLSYYDGPPPWPLDGKQVDRMEAVGIEPLTAEGSIVHYHAHLDVFYDGKPITVPQYVGIDFDKQRISPMHTHFPSGVIHIEANKDEQFTLGQFLSEWGVKAKDDCVGDKCGDEVAVFVDGSIQDVHAADLVIKADTEIALVLGTQPPDIPSGYDCTKFPGDACPNIPS